MAFINFTIFQFQTFLHQGSPQNPQFLADHQQTIMKTTPPHCALYQPCSIFDPNQMSFK